MRIKEYLDTFGIKQSWLAERIGIHPRAFNLMLHGKRTLPRKYWSNIVLISNGLISYEDLKQEQEKYRQDESQKLQERIDAYCRDHRKLPNEKTQGK